MSKQRFAAGRKSRGLPIGLALANGTAPTRPVLHYRAADPDDRPSDRILPAEPRVPTPPEQFVDVLAVSILERMAATHAKLAEDCRKLAATLTADDPNEVA